MGASVGLGVGISSSLWGTFMVGSSFMRAAAAAAIVVLAGCALPPNNSIVDDQVPNTNEELTRLKDVRWERYEWPVVDGLMTSGVAGLPAPAAADRAGGCAVGLAEEGEIAYLGAYGEASSGRDWNFGTIAPVGSVSKTFTALAVMELATLPGSPLALSSEVGDHLSTSNADLASVLVSDLLDHTSGVGGSSINAAFSPNWAPASTVAACDGLNDPLGCPPISQMLVDPLWAFAAYEANETVAGVSSGVYSNVGYTVLGAIIDEITSNDRRLGSTQRGYEPYVWSTVGSWNDNILDGRRMLSPALTHSWRVADGDFLSYARGFPEDAWEDTEVEGWEGPSGGWALTIGDLTRFAMLFGDDDFVSNDVRTMMVQTRSTPLQGISYGFGVMLASDFPNRTRWWHGGVIGSHHALWAHWPNVNGRSYAVALQCNNGPNDQFVWNVLQAAAVQLLNRALIPADEQPILKPSLQS